MEHPTDVKPTGTLPLGQVTIYNASMLLRPRLVQTRTVIKIQRLLGLDIVHIHLLQKQQQKHLIV